MATPPIQVPPQTVQVTAPPSPPPPQTQNPPVQTQIPTQPTAPVPANAHPIHAAVSGWQALMGTHPEVDQTESGPVTRQVQNKPGDFFRSILAGALMGAASGGAEPDRSGSGWEGASRGYLGADAERKQQLARQQTLAQQQWDNNLKEQENQRNEQAFQSQQTLRKAQLAVANQELLHSTVLTQGASYDLHHKMVQDNQGTFDTLSAVEKPVFSDIGESQMQDYIKNNPGAATNYKWVPTGVQTVMTKGPNGEETPSYQYTYSAFDMKSPVPLSASQIKEWTDKGLFKYHPEWEATLTAGKTLSPDQYLAVDKTANNLYNNNLAQTKAELETDLIKTNIDRAKAAITASNAQAREASTSAAEKSYRFSKEKDIDQAWKDLEAVGNDPSKLSPKDKIALGEAAQPAMATTLNAIRDAQAGVQNNVPGAQEQLKQLWGQYNTLSTLSQLGSAAPKNPVSVSFNGQTGVFATQADADAFIKAHPGAEVLNTNDPVKAVLQSVEPLGDATAAENAINNSPTLTLEQKKQATNLYYKWLSQQAADTRQSLKDFLRELPGQL